MAALTSLDKIAVPLALKLINKYGTSFQYTSVVNGAYNPATSQTAANNNLVVTLNGIFDEYAESLRFLGNKLGTGTNIIEGDKKVTIAASGLTFTPKVGDLVSVFNTQYQVMSIAQQTSGNAIALYVLHIRLN